MEENRALTVVGSDVEAITSPLDMVPAHFRAGLVRRSENRKTLIEWVRSALVEGVDFGKIHTVSRSKCPDGNSCKNPYHWSKDSLWKPGAEKICGMMNVIPSWPNLKDYERAALDGVEIKTIILRCEIVGMGGQVLGEGTGARSLSQDYNDLNKSLKMAKKSSLIDATLTMGGLSEVFTQDVEDVAAFGQTSELPTMGSPHETDTIGSGRARKFLAWSDSEGIPRPHVLNAAKKYHHVEDLADLTEEQAKILMNHLKEGKKAANGNKGQETTQQQPQTLDPSPDTDSEANPQPSASGAAEASLFPPDDDDAVSRYKYLVTTATAYDIPLLAKKGVCLYGLINECWPDRGDTDIHRLPVEVYDRVDARMTEIVNARKQ